MQRYQPASHRQMFKVLGGTRRSQAATMVLQPGKSTGGPDNKHDTSDQWLYVVSGRGRATIAGETVSVAAGELICIEAGETHEIQAGDTEPLVTFSIYAPPEYEEDDSED